MLEMRYKVGEHVSDREIDAYLHGLEDGGAIKEYGIVLSNRTPRALRKFTLLDESKKAVIHGKLREYGAELTSSRVVKQ